MKTLPWIIYILPYVFLASGAERRPCPSPPQFPGATLMRFTPDTALFKCAAGYEPSGGSPVIRCSEGQWSSLSLLCQKKSCGNAGELLNGRFTYDSETVLGSKAYAVCDAGFTLKGPKEMECGADGWPTPLPTCEEGAATVTCPAPKVTNSVKNDLAPEYSTGDVLTVRCSPGFQNSGLQEITCGSDGQWQPPPPKCVSATVSPVPPKVPATSKLPPTPPKVPTFSKMPTPSKAPPTPPKVNTASKLPDTTPKAPTPSKLPPVPPKVPTPSKVTPKVPLTPPKNGRCGVPENKGGANFYLAPKYRGQKSFAHRAKVYYMCDPGYVHSRGSKYRQCMKGEWSPLDFSCRRRLCGSAGELDFGRYEYTGVEFGDTATAVCDEGYLLVGQAVRNCLSRGWDGHPPVCEVLACDDPPEVPNAVTTGFSVAPFEYNTVVTYRCLVGTLTGPDSIWCTEDGTWSSPLPQCKDVTCPTPNIPNAMWVKSRSGRYQYRDNIYISCSHSYTLVGPSIITCNERGQWTPELPKCKSWNSYRRW